MSFTLHTIHRYPIKGLNGQPCEALWLQPGAPLPGDRRFALAHGKARREDGAPRWMDKRNFLALHTLPRLAALQCEWHEGADGDDARVTIREAGVLRLEARLAEADGRAALERFFTDFAGADAHGGVRLLEAGDFAFTDAQQPLVSIITRASLEAAGRFAGQAVDWRRFRANLVIDGPAAFAENGWVGRTLSAGSLAMRVVEPIERCAATCANPDKGVADLNLPRLLARGIGEPVFGVYAQVITPGELRPGMTLTLGG